ncbi:MAG: RDD family protein [Actinomycetota bacterium]
MHYVGVGRRFIAVVIDAIVGIIWTYPFAEIDRRPGYIGFQLQGGRFVGAAGLTILYFIVMEGFFGASVGKFATGLRVVREDGTKLTFGAAAIRNVLRVIDALPVAYLLGAILVWTSSKKQRLGDRLATTVVVEASSLARAAATGEPPAPGTWTPSPIAPGGITPPPMPPPPPVPGADTPVPDPVPPPEAQRASEPEAFGAPRSTPTPED